MYFCHRILASYLRAVQGIGISGPVVISYLVIADIYSTQQQQLLGILNGVITLAMAFAPVVGSYVSFFFHWQGNFVLLLFLGIICLILSIFFIPFRMPNSQEIPLIKGYKAILKSSKALYYIAVIVTLMLSYWVFIGISPLLYIGAFEVPLTQFGLYQGSLSLTYAIASFTSSYFVEKFGQRACFMCGMGGLIIFMILDIFLFLLETKNPLLITLAMQFLAFGVIFPVNILYPLSLEVVPHSKAKITALIVASRLFLTALGLQSVSYIYDGTFKFIGMSMLGVLVVMFIFCAKLLQKEKTFLLSFKKSIL